MSIQDKRFLYDNHEIVDLSQQVSTPPSSSREGIKPILVKARPSPKESKEGKAKDRDAASLASEELMALEDANDVPSGEILSQYQGLHDQCQKMAREFAIDHVVVKTAQGVSAPELAKQFQKTDRTIYYWKKKGLDRFAETYRKHHSEQIAQIIAEDMRHFELRMQLGMAMATTPNASPKETARGLKIAEAAHQGLIDFRSKLGFYAHRPLARAVKDETDSEVSDAELVADCAQEIMNAVFLALRGCDERDETDVA